MPIDETRPNIKTINSTRLLISAPIPAITQRQAIGGITTSIIMATTVRKNKNGCAALKSSS